MEWHPSGNLTLRLRVREEWRVLPRTPTTSHPLNPITVKDLPSCESIGPDSHHRRTSVSGWTGTRKKSTATTTAAVPWFGLDPLSAALLSQQQQQDHDYQDYPHQSQPHSRHRAAPAGEDVGGGGQVRRGSTVVTKTTVHKKDDDEWNTFRSQVLSRYTTQEKLTIKSSFLSPGSESSLSASSAGAGGAGGETPVATVSMTDQVRNRLQQLDDVDDGLREERGLTAKEFADRIDSLKKSLLQSWSSDQRVRALKIVIQSAKLLSDVSVVRFYPSVFALVTGEILDHFSSLVHNRIEERWRGAGSKELAVETCRNWIYKISSIREIIPRFYVEAAILRTHSFLHDNESERRKQMLATLTRLLHTVRGIADPLVSSYARTFLARVACNVLPAAAAPGDSAGTGSAGNERERFFRQTFAEVFLSKGQFSSSLVSKVLADQKVSMRQYVHLFSPSLTWVSGLLAAATTPHPEAWFQEQLQQEIRSSACPELNDTVLTAVVSTFRPEFIVSNFDDIMQLMQVMGDPSSPGLLTALGKAFASSSGGGGGGGHGTEERTRILRLVWAKVAVLSPPEYLTCAAAWIDFVAEHFSAREINSLLNDVIKHTAADSSSIVSIDSASSGATSDSSLKSVILCRVVATGSRSILAMDSIQPLIQSIRDPDVRVSVSRTILQSCCVQQQQLLLEQESETEAETVDRQRWHPDDEQWLDVLHTLSFCCRTVHDSVSAISLEDERREVANLLTGYLRLVTFCPVLDREQRFTLLQDARSDYFAKMDSVLSFLVYAVNSLIAPSSNSCEPPSRHFVRSCLAFAFTTIPSIDDPVSKLLLYAQSAEMGLANAALSQLDSFLKAGMQLLSQQSGNTVVVSDSFFASYCRKLLSLLLVVPDHPDHEPLYLLKGLVAVVSGHDFQSEEVRFLLRLDLMCFLSVASQSEYPVHADGVDSNDVLYGGCESGEERAAFVTTVTSLMRETMDQLLQHLTPGQGPAAGAGQGSSGDKGQEDVDEAWMRRADLCLHLFTRLVTFSDLSRSHKLATRLWHLMRKHGDNGDRGKVRSGGTPFQVRMREAIKSCPDRELRERITSQ